MIKFTDDYNGIIKLWQECFGDSREDIQFFIDNSNNAECLAYCEKSEIKAMLFLVDCNYGNEKGKYIYAACTSKHYRSKGIMTMLLKHSLNLGYKFICLIPASDSLIDFYIGRGFKRYININEIEFNQIPEIKEYLLDGYKLTNPKALLFEGE